MRNVDFRFQISDFGLWALDFGLWTSTLCLLPFAIGLRTLDFGLWTSDFYLRFFQPVFLPNLGESLALAFIIAKDAHIVALAGPAMELGKELAALRLGHRRLRRALGEWTKGLKALESKDFSMPKTGALGTGRSRGLVD